MLVHTSLLLFIIVTEHVFTSSKEAEAASGADLSAALTQQMEEHRKEHQKHLNSLRDELDAKQEVIDSLKEYVIPYKCSSVVTDGNRQLALYIWCYLV